MGPQPNLLHLCSVKSGIPLNPGRSHKSGDDEDNADDADGQGGMACQRPLSLHVGIREQVVCDPHFNGVIPEKWVALTYRQLCVAAKMAEDRCNLYWSSKQPAGQGLLIDSAKLCAPSRKTEQENVVSNLPSVFASKTFLTKSQTFALSL